MLTYKGHYTPKNKNKYCGSAPIIYRSSWEMLVMKWLDSNSNVVRWGSESIIIPYLCEVDNKVHRYFIDFNIEFQNGTKYLIEIKPESKTKMPTLPKSGRQTRRYLNEVVEYAQNISKWKAAKKFAEEHGCVFQIWDQHVLRNLGIRVPA